MTPETAAAIARRIGMYQRAPDVAPHALWWYDPGAVCCDEVDEDDPNGLANYLATGDRPLRVMEAYKISVTHDIETGAWEGTIFMAAGSSHFWHDSGPMESPVECIMPCAEALEEGR